MFPKYLFIAACVLLLIFGVSADQSPNITEIEDNFENVFNYSEYGFDSNNTASNPIEFTEESHIQVCVTEVEHKSGAELEYNFMFSGGSREGEQNGNCFNYNLTEQDYASSVGFYVTVTDESVPYDSEDTVTVEYNNTINPLEESNLGVTDYNMVMIEKSRLNSIENRLESQNETISTLRQRVEDKETRIDMLEGELEDLQSGLTGILASLF